MRTFLIGGAVGFLILLLAACSGSSTKSASEQAMQRQADLWAIHQIEKNFHKATSTQDIDLMMSLWAPNAAFTLPSGKTLTGEGQIRRFWRLDAPQFRPKNRWLSDTTAYKVRITANGERGTLYFECHYIDVKTRKVVRIASGDMEVARINGRWLITDVVAASPTLSR
jgi:outer membrane biogenesis lipoprotein LolB